MMDTAWEADLSQFLADLTAVQDETLQVLSRKRELVVAGDSEGLQALAAEEERLIARLKECLDRREQLLSRAAQQGHRATNLRELARGLPGARRQGLDHTLRVAQARTRLLQHHSLVNWLVIQRTLLHLSQMLEIIATGGRLQPTYGKGETSTASGALVDRAA